MQSTNVFLPDQATGQPVAQKSTPGGAAHVANQALAAGENQSSGRQDVFAGGYGVAISATGVVVASPCGVYRLRCITAGTITSLHDNASAASGTLIVGSTAMTAGQVIEIGEYLDYGAWAVVASGTYRLVRTPTY
jgi:hypothetical protein